MAHYTYDRLSAQDVSFLIFEKGNINMHVSSTGIYKAASLKTKEGGIDFERIKKAIGDVLHRIPRYRQKLMWVQKNRTAVWIDDAQFKLDYHVRHTSLPKPGTRKQLKELASRIIGQKMDRAKPLWEIWVVEGLKGDEFALISKIHHSMIDGSAGVELSQVLMSRDPTFEPEEPPVYYPRPVPTLAELWRDEVERFWMLPIRAMRNFQDFAQDSQDLIEELAIRGKAIASAFSQIGGAADTPMNGPNGPHRIIDWLVLNLDDVKAVRYALGCTVNDVVLCTVTGAVRTFFLNRQVSPDALEFRVAAPVSVRRESERGKMGNRVSSWSVVLPIAESDPLAQLEKIHEITSELKESSQALGVEMMMGLAEWAPSLLSLGARAASQANNSIVTNVPGPQFPLYLIGAEMVEMYPSVPLLENMGLGIALMSYNGKLCWGFNADYGRVSDLPSFVKYTRNAFEKLAMAAGVTLGANQGKAAPRAAVKSASSETKTATRSASASATTAGIPAAKPRKVARKVRAPKAASARTRVKRAAKAGSNGGTAKEVAEVGPEVKTIPSPTTDQLH